MNFRSLLVALLIVPLTALPANFTITAAGVLGSTSAKPGDLVACETIAAGDVVYRNGTLAYLATSTSAVKSAAYAFALNSASTGQPLRVVYEDPGLVLGTTNFTTGQLLVLSSAPGKICPAADLTSGWYATVVGVAVATNKISVKMLTSGAAVP